MQSAFKNSPGTMTMEVYKNLPEGTLAELIDNVIHMSPSPVKIHQQVLQTIFRRLSEVIEDSGKGEIIIVPFDIYLDSFSNAVQADISIILKGNAGYSHANGHFHGAPDIIIEILSSGNMENDLIKKKDLYERFGVKEYWIVDPQTKESLGYFLHGAKYAQIDKSQNCISLRSLAVSIAF
jgi:Uma2 family endonuclease